MPQLFPHIIRVMFFVITNCGFSYAQEHPGNQGLTTRLIDTTGILNDLARAQKLRETFPDSAKTLISNSLQQSKAVLYREGIMMSLTESGILMITTAQYPAAIKMLYTALSYCDHGAYSGYIYNNIGNAYNYLGQFEAASRAYLKAIYQVEKYPSNIIRLSHVYFNLCTVFDQLEQNEKTIFYTDRALPVAQKEQEHGVYAALLGLKGLYHYRKNEYASGIVYFDSSISYARRYRDYPVLHAMLTNISALYISAGRPEKALEYLLEAKSLMEKHPVDFNNTHATFSALGDVYLQLKNYKEAGKYMLSAWANAHQIPKERLFLLKKLSELYDATGRSKEAYKMQQDYITLKDSLHHKEVAIAVSDMETRYRTAEKDKEIAQSQLLISSQQEQLVRKNLWITLIAGGAFMFVLLLLWVYIHLKQKNKLLRSRQQVLQLQAKIEGEEIERKRIARELHDGINSQIAGAQSYLLTLANLLPEVKTIPAFQEAGNILKKSASDIRQVAHNLMPGDLTGQNLSFVLSTFCRNFAAAHKLFIEFHPYGRFNDITPQITLNIYRIIQELLHNIVKHAMATEVVVLLNNSDDEISLIVEDNGKGMSAEAADGIGLINIRDRVNAHSGTVEIESASGKGTLVSICIPHRHLKKHANPQE